MKKILLTALISTLPAYAFEDYMIISNSAVKSVTVQNEKILTAQPVFTIDNEKKIIILTPKNEGKTKITINRDDGEKIIDVKVSENLTQIKSQEGFAYFLMDTPPQKPSIPMPPANSILPQPPKYKGGH